MTTVTWTTPSGNSYVINDARTDAALDAEGLKGRGAPPTRSSRDRIPGQPGSTIRTLEDDSRTIEIPMGVYGSTASALSTAVEAWIRYLDPNQGDGTLTFTTGAGASRSIRARCTNGLDIYEKLGSGTNIGWVWWTAEFECEPHFYDPSEANDSWTTATGVPFFPFFPLSLSSSEVFAAPSIANAGHVETYPVWQITGPAAEIRFTHVATGRVLAWSGTLGAGEVLTLDARDRSQSTTPKSALLQDGSNVFSLLSTWDFFPLAVGSQTVQIEMTGATAQSAVAARWREFYRSAY